LSLLSKEVAVILPFLLVVFDLLRGRFKSKGNIIRYGVYALLLIGYFYIRLEALEGFFDRLFSNLSLTGLISANAYDFSSNLTSSGLQKSTEEVSIGGVTQPIHSLSRVWSFIGIILGSYLFYIKKLIYPYSLNPYAANIPNGIPNLLTSIIVLLLMILFSIRSIFRGKGLIAFCIFWILLSLGPLSVIANVSKGTLAASPLAERFLFIPSIGFCLLLGYLLIELIESVKYKKLVWAIIILIGATYFIFTINGQRVWKDNLTFWSFVVRENPDENVPHINYGAALRKVGRKKEAIEQYLIPLNPSAKDKKTGITLAANNLALIYLELGDFEEAEKWFIKALDFNRLYRPRFDANMGTLYFLKAERNYNRGNDYQSDYEQAERYLSMAVKRKHDDGRMQLYLAKAYLRIGNNEKARIHAEIAIKSKRLSTDLQKVAESILKHTE
ncbi:MAG: tetratricopeptide repeat protein, partial [Thermodesulfobacteriota bacterium]